MGECLVARTHELWVVDNFRKYEESFASNRYNRLINNNLREISGSRAAPRKYSS